MYISYCDHILNLLNALAKSRGYDLYSHPSLDLLCALANNAQDEGRGLDDIEASVFINLAGGIRVDILNS